MVKRLLGCAVVVAMLLGPVTARADAIEGNIMLPNPAAVALGLGLTEVGSACDPGGATQGVDGFWIDLSGPGSSIALTTADPVADLSLWFYDAECALVADSGIDDTGTGGEAGSIPGTAAWVIVDMLIGANPSFAVTVS